MKVLPKIILSLVLISLTSFCYSQAEKINLGSNFIASNLGQFGLVESDINSMIVTDMYQSKHNGVTHIYYTQAIDGIPVHNAVINVNLTKDNQVLFSNSTFVEDVQKKVQKSADKLSAIEAVNFTAQDLGFKNPEPVQLLKSVSENELTFKKSTFSDGDIRVKKKYFLTEDNTVELVWEVNFADSRNDDSWNSMVSAANGKVLDHENRTIYCQHSKGQYHNHDASCRKIQESVATKKVLDNSQMGATYRVYPFPIESPLYGDHQLVTDPHIVEASPYGWHDIDGVDGPEFTFTRGNNVHAYEDEDDNDISGNNEPEGGMELMFDFTHNQELEPEGSIEADVTNLFYANNMVHDITYLLGFDEAAGNFQVNNYGNGGTGGDHVIAHALDGSGTNNANFSLTRDGDNGNMNMFRWDLPTAGLFTVNEPQPLAGSYPNGEAGDGWGFDNSYATVDVTGEMALAFDADPQFPDLVCGDVVNPEEIDGKIAMIYRGLCEFGRKALNAEDAGAIAVVICNVPGAGGDPTSDGSDPISGGMAPGSVGADVTVPVIAMGFQDCNAIKASIEAGFPVTATIKPGDANPIQQVSSGFDNGIIIHEYGHGVSGRLVGGPNTVCVGGRDEQMGEGWSDILALMLTVEPGDEGTDSRGIGNYADGRGPDGRGIRRQPYSTDRNINSQTFKDIKATTAPHPLGEVWVDMLWDMYWEFVELYGFDADWSNTESGNFKATQLVIDGMKMIGCDVGFINGRDAILAADMANNNGEHQCMIWNVFAERGLGWFADGGSSNNRNDGVENFDTRPDCIESLKIWKDIASKIDFGSQTMVTLTVANHKPEDLTEVVVSDFIPEGLSYVDGSASMEPTLSNDQIIFDLDMLASQQEMSITYMVEADGSANSQVLRHNAVETSAELNQWEREIVEGNNFWQTSSSTIFPVYSGEQAWYVEEIDDNTEQIIGFNNFEVVGELPVLRFFHRINTEFARNGGFVEFSLDNVIWTDAKDLFIRNGYDCPLQYTTFAIPSHFAFSGRTDDYIDSWIDLSAFKGQTISIRFRFGTNAGTGNTPNDETFAPGSGWFIDDLDLIDLVQAETQACVSTTTDQDCTPFFTSILDSEVVSSTNFNSFEGVDVQVFPNPANDYFTVNINADHTFDAELSLWSMDGRMVHQQDIKVQSSDMRITTSTNHLEAGFYIVHLKSGSEIYTHKLMIH